VKDLLSNSILDGMENDCISYQMAIAKAIADENRYRMQVILYTPLPRLPDPQI
jgi:hypothetical protein